MEMAARIDNLQGKISAMLSEFWCRIHSRHHYPIVHREYIGRGTSESFNRWVYYEKRTACPHCENYPKKTVGKIAYRKPLHHVEGNAIIFDE
jgi:hypothetical protein